MNSNCFNLNSNSNHLHDSSFINGSQQEPSCDSKYFHKYNNKFKNITNQYHVKDLNLINPNI